MRVLADNGLVARVARSEDAVGATKPEHPNIAQRSLAHSVSRASTILLLVFLSAAGCAREQPAGVLVPDPPTQVNVSRQSAFEHGDYRIQPLATFEITARVLGKERYWFDRGAEIAPYDLALGWGRMSDSAVLDQISISQSWRWYRWRVRTPPIPMGEIATSSANMHMVPSDDLVRRSLNRVRKGDVVRIVGKLVEVAGPEGFRWKSSLTRGDTGDGACELVWVEDLEIL